MLAIFEQLAAGFRLALVLFAAMSLLTTGRWQPDALTDARRLQAQRLNALGWGLMAWGIVLYSPAHAAWLLGHPTPPVFNRGLDALASALACAAFIKVLAYRGLMRGLSWQRVRRGVVVNNLIVVATVGATWLTRQG